MPIFFFFKSLIDLQEISLMAWSDGDRKWIGGDSVGGAALFAGILSGMKEPKDGLACDFCKDSCDQSCY